MNRVIVLHPSVVDTRQHVGDHAPYAVAHEAEMVAHYGGRIDMEFRIQPRAVAHAGIDLATQISLGGL